MRNIPSIPPSPSTPADAVDVKPVSYLRAAMIVGERSLTPLVFPHHRPAQAAEPIPTGDGQPLTEERRRGIERRRFSRRVRRAGASPYDTRAPEERRSGKRRESDTTTKIQEKA